MPASVRLVSGVADEVAGGGALADRLDRPRDQLDHRPDQHEHQQHARQRGREQRARAAQAPRHDRLAARERPVVAGPPAQQPLERDQRERQRQQDRGELQRRRLVEGAVPDAVDRVGHRAVVEEVDGAEVRQRLHHRERRAGGQRRARQRQRHARDRPPVAEAERARRLHRVARLLQERAAPEDVDVRVEHERQHDDRADRRAHLRELEAVAEHRAQRPLQRARLVVLAEQHEHEHVGRHRQRQHERPVEPAPAREVVERDERGQRAAEQPASPRRRRARAPGSRAAPRRAASRRSRRTPPARGRTTAAAPRAAPRRRARRPRRRRPSRAGAAARASRRAAGAATSTRPSASARSRPAAARRRARRRSGRA